MTTAAEFRARIEAIRDTTSTVAAANLQPGDVIYGTDTVTKVYRHHRHAWRVVAETTGGEYSFPETTRVPTKDDQ